MLAKRVAIDLGTTRIRVGIPKQGILRDEPSVVALRAASEELLAVGDEAKAMLGRTPESIIAAHPLREGVIANFRIAEAILRYSLSRILGLGRILRPELMVTVPAGVTSTERRAVVDAGNASGARRTYLIKQPVAAALGAGVPIAGPSGNLVMVLGGGITEVAVIALGDTVASTSLRIGGQHLDKAIAAYTRKKHGLIIGDQTAESVKQEIGAAMPLKKELSMEVSGSNAVTGLPESIMLHSSDITAAIRDPLQEVLGAVKRVLQDTPPELAADVMERGMIITGGSAKLRKLDELLTKVTGVPCQLAEHPETCVAEGALLAMEHLDSFKRSVLWSGN